MQGDQDRDIFKIKSGKMNGVKVVLDLHSNDVSFGTLDQEIDTFTVFLGTPADFPFMKKRALMLQPGKEHLVEVSASVVTAADIRAVDPEARGCLFPEESRLALYSSYTATNCLMECHMAAAEEELARVPWYLPQVTHILSQLPLLHRRGTPQPVTLGPLVISPP